MAGRAHSKHIIFLTTMLLIVLFYGNAVLANGMPSPFAYFKMRGISEDTEWYMGLLIDEEPEADVPSDESVSADTNDITDKLVERHGEDVIAAIDAFSIYAEENGLNYIEQSSKSSRSQATERHSNGAIAFEPFGYIDEVGKVDDYGRYRIAVYFPETGELAVSEPMSNILERDSSRYFIDCSDMSDGALKIYAPDPSHYRNIDIVTRMVFTILVETLTAFIGFKIRDKKFLLFIAVINLISNGIFNLVWLEFYAGRWSDHLISFGSKVFWGEVAVFVIEGIIFAMYGEKGFKKANDPWSFSFFANLFSAIGSIMFFMHFDSLIW
jgi:hypothetical protein